METRWYRVQNICFTGFKSYYVVWKLAFSLFFIFAHFEFKSYYVVWKPDGLEQIICDEERFKSYYVVWKRDAVVFGGAYHDSLNRTM